MASNSHKEYEAAARAQGAEVEKLRAQYERLRQDQLAGLKDVAAAETLTAEQRKAAAAARRQEATALEHEATLLGQLGASQKGILDLQRQALALRLEAARVEGDANSESIATRKLELELARQVADEERRAATERQDHYRSEWEAQERKLANFRESYTRAEQLNAEFVETERHARASATAMGGMAEAGNTARVAWGQVGSAITGIQSAIALGKQAYQFIDDIAQSAAAAEKASRTLQVDITGASAAFEGYVDNVRLAQIGNKGFALGVVQNGKDLERLAAGVSAIADDLGGDKGQMLEDAIAGIGRKSSETLDNLGIVLNTETAEREYAEMLGKTVAQLTAYEKSQAFTKVAIERVAGAAREGTKVNDSYAESWNKGKVSVANFTDSLYGFDVQGGKIRETIRELDAGTLELFGERDQVSIAQINRALLESGLNYEQIKEHLIEINGIETMRGGQLNREQRLQLEEALVELAGVGLRHQEKQIKAAERAAELAEQEAQAKADADAVSDLDHQVAVLQAMGASEEEIVAAQEVALELRIEQAQAAGDLATETDLQRKLELLILGSLAKKNKSRGQGATLAERERAAAEATLRAVEDQIRMLELRSDLTGGPGVAEYEVARRTHELALARLDAEERVLLITRAKGAVERTNNAARLEAIERERAILGLEQRVDDREREVELIEEATAATRERLEVETELGRQERERLADVIELEDYRIKRDEQAIRARGEWAAATAKTEVDRLRAVQQTERELHDLRQRQSRAEHEARVRELDERQLSAEAMPVDTEPERLARTDELRQVTHDRELERLDRELEVRSELDAAKQAMFERDQAMQAAQFQALTDALGTFENFRSQLTDLTGFMAERSAAEADAELQRTVQSLQSKSAAQQQQNEYEIAAAEGNAARQQQLRQQGARQELAIQRQIELAQAKHADRVKRKQMQAAGSELAILAAIEAVKAVISFASQNYLEGGLHLAAAIVAGTKAGMLLSGNIPGGGAVGALGSGSSMGAANDSSGYVDPSNVPGSVPGQAAQRESSTARGTPAASGGNTVVINGGVNAWGSIDDDTITKLARDIAKAGLMKEA